MRSMRHITAVALVVLAAGPAMAQERPEDYMTFSCTHLPAMKVTQQLVALYGDKGDKLVVASDLENYLALVSLVASGLLPLDAVELSTYPFARLEEAINRAGAAQGLQCTVASAEGERAWG